MQRATGSARSSSRCGARDGARPGRRVGAERGTSGVPYRDAVSRPERVTTVVAVADPLPGTLLCLVKGCSGWVFEDSVEVAGDVALEAAADLAGVLAVGGALSIQVRPRNRVNTSSLSRYARSLVPRGRATRRTGLLDVRWGGAVVDCEDLAHGAGPREDSVGSASVAPAGVGLHPVMTPAQRREVLRRGRSAARSGTAPSSLSRSQCSAVRLQCGNTQVGWSQRAWAASFSVGV